MKEFIRIAADLGKNSFQVHAVTNENGDPVRRKLSRAKFREFAANAKPCLVAMEACGSARYWGRELMAMGHDVRLIPPVYVKPYVKRGKNDAADAAAICEAATRPDMRFVPVKSAEQQATLMLHGSRELLIKQRTMLVNAPRGHLSEFGIIAAKGISHVDELIELVKQDATLPKIAKGCVDILAAQIASLNTSIKAIEAQLKQALAQDEVARLLDAIPGVGLIVATAVRSIVPDGRIFKAGRDFSAWMGLTPRQNSTGGKEKLGSITKQGNRYLRKQLVVASTSLIRVAKKYTGELADWINALRARKPERFVSVALANKLGRIIWAVMTTGESFRKEKFAKA
ncbi:MAG: IS110 family transposase [Methylocystis sp.]